MVSVIDNNFGFIITRHVICELTNQYWLYSVKQIRKFYPKNAILIIDDKSNYEYVKITNNYLTQEDLKMCKIIQSEFLGAGECLPFYYFYKYKPFKTAVIIHDSVFIQKYINFMEYILQSNVKFLWHFDHYFDNPEKEIEMLNLLNFKNTSKNEIIDFYNNKYLWKGCFGVMCVINLNFLEKIVDKYDIFVWLNIIKNRNNRYQCERVFAVLFYYEEPKLINFENQSIFGDIFQFKPAWGYRFSQYIQDKELNNFHEYHKIVKCWSER